MNVPCTIVYCITILKLKKYVCTGGIGFWCLCNISFVQDLPQDGHKRWPKRTCRRFTTSTMQYTGCPRRNVKYFGRVFLELNYTDITQNTYIQSWTVMEIMAREVWNFDSCYTLTDYQIHIETGRNTWFL